MMGLDAPSDQVCSRAGCTAPAVWNVNWRNPRIHTIDRVKIWLACDEHRQYLFDYLDTRSFPVVVTPLAEHVDVVPDRAPTTGAPPADAP
jgi:hypothetical protein